MLSHLKIKGEPNKDFSPILFSLPDWAGEASPGEAPHPRDVHHDDPGIEAHAGGAEAGQLLHHAVHILHGRHPHDLVSRELAVKNEWFRKVSWQQ